MRIKFPYYIPVIVFLISLSLSAWQVISYKININRVFSIAESNGWPVIAMYTLNEKKPVAITTLDGPLVHLLTDSAFYGPEEHYFDDDGNFHWFDSNKNIDYMFDFPGYHQKSRQIEFLDNESLHHSRQGRFLLVGGLHLDDPDGYNPDKAVFLDIATRERREINFKTPAPWAEFLIESSLRVVWYFVADDHVFFQEVVSNPDVPRASFPDRRSLSIWRYAISTGEWLHVVDGKSTLQQISASSDGKVVEFASHGPGGLYTEFIDVETGESLVRENAWQDVAMGTRWTAIGTDNHSSSVRATEIYLYDMENDWERYDMLMGLESNNELYALLALYEPTPD